MVVCYSFATLFAKINSACATINSALISSADVHFPLCMSLSSYTFTCIVDCHHKLKRISTSTTCHVHLHSKSKLLICTSSGGAFATYEDNTLSFTISHILFPVEIFNQFFINHQKGGDCKCI